MKHILQKHMKQNVKSIFSQNIKKVLKSISILTFACIASTSFAKVLTLYDLPKADAKATGSIDLAKGVTVIYAPKGSDYVKIADPNNGNVGWVKQSDLNNAQHITFTHSFMQDGKGSRSYEVVEYGVKPEQQQRQTRLTEEQAKQLKAIQDQTQEIQNLMNKTVNDMFGVFFKLAEPYQPKQSTKSTAPVGAPEKTTPAQTTPAQTMPAQTMPTAPATQAPSAVRPTAPATPTATP